MTDRLTPATEPAAILSVTPPAALSVPLDQNPASVYLASLSNGSRRTMRTALNTIGELLGVGAHIDAENHDMRCLVVPWGQLRYQHTAALRAALQARYAPATANKLLVALRRVLLEARRLGQISADDYATAIDLKPIAGERLPKGRTLDGAEVRALLQECANDPTAAGARDGAIIGLLRGIGIRRAELAALDLADYEPETGAITIHNGKGNQNRVVYAPSGSRALLSDWLSVRGNAAGPLFYRVSRGGGLLRERLAPQAAAIILQRRVEAAGVPPCTPHDLRRTYISELLDAGADISTVRSLAGHESVETTARYDRRGEAAKQKAVELVHVPYISRNSSV
jgi:integrase